LTFNQSMCDKRRLSSPGAPMDLWKRTLTTSLLALFVALPAFAEAERSEQSAGKVMENPFDFEDGPMEGQLGRWAKVKVAEGYSFTGAKGSRALMEQMGNVATNRELGTIVSDDLMVIFEFDEVGYIKDDDRDALDAEAMLKSMREGQREANKILTARGHSALEINRWHMKPRYDEATNNLEWAPVVRELNGGAESVNYNVRLLGRRGVMEVTLLVKPEEVENALPHFRELIKGFAFTSGEDYASFRKGDKVAEYGLAALVTGGALAVAAKSGLLGRLWKFLLVGVLALGAGIKRLFGGGKSQE
jgi:uncharacterized membrane-anchored protein